MNDEATIILEKSVHSNLLNDIVKNINLLVYNIILL